MCGFPIAIPEAVSSYPSGRTWATEMLGLTCAMCIVFSLGAHILTQH